MHMVADYPAIGPIWHTIQFFGIFKRLKVSVGYGAHFVRTVISKVT